MQNKELLKEAYEQVSVSTKEKLVAEFPFLIEKTVGSKTIKEWLEELEEPYRSEALDNMDWFDRDNMEDSLICALYSAFDWCYTPQGLNYWSNLVEKLKESC